MTDQSLVAAEPAIMRRINAARALREVHRLGRLTVTQLVERTGLSRRTAEAVLDGLVQAGLVADEPPVHRGDRVGRPARTFRFRTDAALAMGVDVDTRSIRAMLSDLSGSILGMGEVGVTPSSSRAVRLAAIHEAARQALDESGQPADGLQAVTIGTPGVVLPDGSVTVCKVLQNWSNFPLGRALSDGFPCPVIVENDTNLSAVGERWRGTSADVDDVVWVQAGRRVRIAILVGGRLYRGADGAAGEVGWLSQLAWDAVRDHPLSASGSGRSQVDANYVRLVTAATADPQASGLFDEYGRALSLGLAAVVLTLNPRYLVIGGAAAALAGEVLTASIRRHLGPMCLVLPEVRASSLGAEAVVTGAIRMSLDAIEESLFSIRLPRGVPAQAD